MGQDAASKSAAVINTGRCRQAIGKDVLNPTKLNEDIRDIPDHLHIPNDIWTRDNDE